LRTTSRNVLEKHRQFLTIHKLLSLIQGICIRASEIFQKRRCQRKLQHLSQSLSRFLLNQSLSQETKLYKPEEPEQEERLLLSLQRRKITMLQSQEPALSRNDQFLPQSLEDTMTEETSLSSLSIQGPATESLGR